jgi:hypothetical protein
MKIKVKEIKSINPLGTVDGETYVIDPRRVV